VLIPVYSFLYNIYSRDAQRLGAVTDGLRFARLFYPRRAAVPHLFGRKRHVMQPITPRVELVFFMHNTHRIALRRDPRTEFCAL
jgi:hypothetical protein